MRYKPKSTAALQIALGGLPDKMRVEVDRNIGVSAKTVGQLRKVTAWPENLVITTPEERRPPQDRLSAALGGAGERSQRAKPTTRAGLASALHSAKRRSRRRFVYPDAHLAMRQAVRIILKSKEEPPWP